MKKSFTEHQKRYFAEQFHIYWGKSRQNYEPDFVAETADTIYLIEVKTQNEISAPKVQEKKRATEEYCQTISQWNQTHDGKPWKYVIIAGRDIHLQSSFEHLTDTASFTRNEEWDFLRRIYERFKITFGNNQKFFVLQSSRLVSVGSFGCIAISLFVRAELRF